MQFMIPWQDRLLSVLRMVSAAALMQHGLQKVFGLLGDKPPAAFGTVPWVAGHIEMWGGVLLFFGLFTRQTAFLCSGLMACAYWMAHGTKSFWPVLNKGELALLYCFIFLYLAAAGGGRWSVDRIVRKVD